MSLLQEDAEQQHAAARSALTLELRPDHIAVVTIDVADEKVNTLKAAFAEQLTELLQEIRRHAGIRGVVLISGKPDSFIAGADIQMIADCHSAREAEALARKGQQTLAGIAAFPVPVIAAIHGACLGGGLELALACHGRVCSLDEKTVLGLPEVQLGLLPGSGGTQRLPRLIGTQPALEMMLTGRPLKARQALLRGLVDEAVPRAILLEVAIKRLMAWKPQRVRRTWRARLLETSPARRVLFSLVHKKTQASTRGNYPAAERIIQVVRQGLEQGESSGYAAEARAFGELAMTPESVALRGLFFASTALKKENGSTGQARPVRQVGILGGGLMGGGIACVTATRAALPVRIRDISNEGLNHALKYSWDLLSKRVNSKRMRPMERSRQMQRLSAGTDYQGFRQRDIVIEAVFEDLALKQQMVAEVEQHAAPDTIFASNTSSLPIADIAAQALRPQQVIGLHYFSPVDKMPLVEVIPHAGTSAGTVATTVALAQRQGKTAIVVADTAGFYFNRILAPYINEAARCLLEGEPVESIDSACVQFGFPVGPIALLDEVGIDIGTKIIPILVQALGERFVAPAAFEAILKDGRKGRKNGRGFYLYPSGARKGRRKKADPEIYTLLHVTPKAHLLPELIAQRGVMAMLNEAVRCLDEGVIRSARDGDIGAVFGMGFPPFLGGPFRYMDRLGIEGVVNTLQRLQQQYGERFAPCERLLAMQQEAQSFYPAMTE